MSNVTIAGITVAIPAHRLDALMAQAKWYGTQVPDQHLPCSRMRTGIFGHIVAKDEKGEFFLYPVFASGKFSLNKFHPSFGGISSAASAIVDHPECKGNLEWMGDEYAKDWLRGHSGPEPVGTMSCEGVFSTLAEVVG